MGVVADPARCTGCPGAAEPPCVECCPGDLLHVDQQTRKVKVRDVQDCWDCMACVKACPNSALETRLPFSLANPGASIRPVVKDDHIIWHCRDCRGRETQYVIPTRTGWGGTP